MEVGSGVECRLAYLAGLVAADGHLKKRDLSIQLYLGDKGLLQSVVETIGKNVKARPKVRFYKGVYEVAIYDREVVKVLMERYLIPAGS